MTLTELMVKKSWKADRTWRW